jgi:penicillin V acylase-like amidase (Ntn superfamily)
VTVNAITEYSTYCTSIVARSDQGQISHVRNLDFAATDLMKQLVYEAVLVKDGQVKAQAPCIAGYYGAFTGHKPGMFSVSYNVRERVLVPEDNTIL